MGKAGRKNAQKVTVAMSGGVDSGAAAALLKGAGFKVEGVFMDLYDSPQFKEGAKNAKKTADILKIPLRILNLKKGFRETVVAYFLKEHSAGRTPNPCVICNREIKFRLLLKEADGLVATGHYARIKDGKLLKGKDKERDQSYFLWQLKRRQLQRVLFPLGGHTKAEARALAKEFKLPLSGISESREICFIENELGDFLARHLKPKPGAVTDKKGKRLASHRGLCFYTIGQRRGIGLAQGPYWVLAKDRKRNRLIVTRNEKDLYRKELVFEKANWISGKAPGFPLKAEARIRYRQRAFPALVRRLKRGQYKIVFSRSRKAVTPGQSVALYWGEELLGGGIIR